MADSDRIDSFADVEEELTAIRHRLNTMEDKVMMERLEEMAVEDQLNAISELVNQHSDDIQKKLALLDQIEDRYEEDDVEKKLNYLYKKLRQIERSTTEGQQVEIEDVHDRLDELAEQIAAVSSEKEGRGLDDVYEKLFTLRDRVKEFEESGGSGEQELDEFRQKLKTAVRQKLDAMDQRIDGIEELLDAELDQDVSIDREALREDIIESLRDDLDAIDTGADQTTDADDVAALAARLDELDERVDSHEDWVKNDLKDRIASLDARFEDHQETIDTLESEVTALREDLSDIDTASDTAAGTDSRSIDTDAVVADVRDDISPTLEDYDERIRGLADIVEQLQAELSDTGNATHTDGSAPSPEVDPGRIDTLEDRLKSVHDELAHLQDQVVTHDSGPASEAIADLRTTLQVQRAELDELRERMREAAFEPEAAGDEALAMGLDTLAERQDAADNRIVELIEMTDELEDRFEALEGSVDHETVEDLQADVKTYSEKVTALQDAVGRYESEITEELEDISGELHDRLESQQQELTSIRQTVMDAKETAHAAEDVVEEMNATVKDAKQRADRAVERANAVSERLDAQTDELENLRDRVDHTEGTTETLEGRVEAQVTDLEEAHDRLEDLESASGLDEADGRLDEMREELGALSDRIETIENRDGIDADLEDEFAERLAASQERVENQLVSVQDRLDTHADRLDAINQSQNVFEAEMSRLMHDQRSLNQEFHEEDKEIRQQLNTLLEAIEEDIDIDAEKLAISEDELEDSISAVGSDQDELDTASDRPEAATNLRVLAEMVMHTQQRLTDLNDTVEELRRSSPTIVE